MSEARNRNNSSEVKNGSRKVSNGMTTKEIFRRLGYPKHSGRVYDLLQKSKNPLLITAIAQKAKVSRVVVYRCIDALKKDKLVVEEQLGKRSYYRAGSAHVLTTLMRTTELETEKLALQQMKAREKDVPHHIRFLHGPSGIRAAFDDVVSHCSKRETFFRYTSEQDLQKVNSYLARDYRAKRDQKKLERKVISNALSGSQKKSRLERFIRFIPAEADQFQQNIIQLVYGKRVCIIDLNLEEVVIIENKQLADFQKTIFKLLYNQLPR